MRRRRQYVVKKGFQLRFALELVAIIVLVPLAVWVNYLMLGQYVLVDAGTLSPDMGLNESIVSLAQTHWHWVLLMYIASVIITAFCMVLYTHRVAGPLFRIEKGLSSFSAGQADQDFLLRKGDYFSDLGEQATSATRKFGETVKALSSKSDQLQQVLKRTNDPELDQQCERIHELLGKYQPSEK